MQDPTITPTLGLARFCPTQLQRAGVTLLLALGAGCASNSSQDSSPPYDDETYRPMGAASRQDDSIGKYLADLSTSITAWNMKTLGAANSQDRRKQSLLEINIRERAQQRFPEILAELEAGPEHNRIIAAAAIGFSKRPEALSPLLAALDDPNEKVAANALLGLGILESPETPLHQIGDLMRYSVNPRTRWSAADCALSLVAAGANPEGIVEPARVGLTDAEEPIVRTQSALILALVGDTESIDALGSLLFDEAPLVSRSAAKSLAYLGANNDASLGAAARALYTALVEGDRDLKLRVQPALVRLSKKNYDLDLKKWEEWVRKLP